MNTVCLCTALPAESRPLIEHFRLKLVNIRGIRCYSNDGIYLVETGIGKLSAAAATAAILQSDPNITALINIGVAGGTASVGTPYLANTIVDDATGKQWHPHLPPVKLLPTIKSAAVHTLDKPSDQYRDDTLFDMEAAGVLSAASRYLDNTRLQCVKTISDNRSNDLHTISKEKVSDWMASCIDPVSTLVEHFRTQALSGETNDTAIEQLIQQLSSHMRISVTDTHSIKRLIQRYYALNDELPLLSDLTVHQRAGNIKTDLEARISAIGTQY